METRVLALMKSVERTRNPDAIRVRPGRKSRKAGGKEATASGSKAGDKKGSRPKARHGAADLTDEAAELHRVCVRHHVAPSCCCQRTWPRELGRCLHHGASCSQVKCQSALAAVEPELSKLRLLGRTESIPQERVIAKTRKYLLAIGDAVSKLGAGDTPPAHDLWDYVSEFTENQCSGEQLGDLFAKLETKRSVTGEAPPPASPDGGAGPQEPAAKVTAAEVAPVAEAVTDIATAPPAVEAAAADEAAELLAAARGAQSTAASDEVYDPDEGDDGDADSDADGDAEGDDDDASDWQAE